MCMIFAADNPHICIIRCYTSNMAAYSRTDFFTGPQIARTVLTLLLLVSALSLGAFAVDYGNMWGVSLLVALGLSTVLAALPLINGETGKALLRTLGPVLFAGLIVLFTSSDILSITGQFLGENIVLAW